MGTWRQLLGVLLALPAFALAGPAAGQGPETETGRTTMEIVVAPGGETEMTCYPTPCEALCRVVQTLCRIQSGRFFRIDDSCSCTETDGFTVDQAMLNMEELMGLILPELGPDEETAPDPFPQLINQSIRDLEATTTTPVLDTTQE